MLKSLIDKIFFIKIDKQNLSSSLIFIALVNLVFNPINLYFGFAFLVLVLLIFIFLNSTNIVLLPFYFYPFLFILKNQHPTNLIFSILPEVSVLFAFIYIFHNKNIKKCEGYLFFIIFLLAFFLLFITFFHVRDIYFLPALIRQYALPLIFLAFFISASLKSYELPFRALKICMVTYSLIAILALLNYFDVIKLLDYEYYRHFEACSNEFIQAFLKCKNLQLSRLNPLLGGSVGTAASILWMLGVVNILIHKKKSSFLIYFSIPLIFTGFFALSFSVIFPIIFTLAVIMFSKYKKYLKQTFISMIIFILFLMNFNLLGEESVFTYFKLTIIIGFINYYNKTNLVNIFFGSGPIINSSKFEFFPDNFIQDVGILRVFTETGIFNFFLLIIILFYIFKKIIWLEANYPSNYNRSLLIMFLTLLSSVHAIIFLTIPFYPLFVVVVSSIIVQYRLVNKAH
jgi:hypothetical protein